MREWVVVLLLSAESTATAQELLRAQTTPLSDLEIVKLQRSRDRRPNDIERRELLAYANYVRARAALDRGDESVYRHELRLAEIEWEESIRIAPQASAPYTLLGMIRAYQGRIDEALDAMFEARQADPRDGLAHANIAAALTYAGGETEEIEKWLARSEKLGVRPSLIEFRRCVLRWRDGNVEAAAEAFYRATEMEPEIGSFWNEAPVPRPLRTFEDLTLYCCASPACGPYMESACARAPGEIAKLDTPAEKALREMREEIARRRREAQAQPGQAAGDPGRERRDVRIRLKEPREEPSEASPEEAAGSE
jgi:tetratricopeptide (TPR) repeat protein